MTTQLRQDNVYNYGTEKRVDKLKNALYHRQKSIAIVMENIWDPHNISACLRSFDAVGIMEICVVYHNGQKFPDFYNTSSASANKWIEWKKFDSIKECYEYLHNQEKKIWTTHLDNSSTSLYDLDLTQNIALVFGNEHTGVSDEAVELADGNFIIPQVGVIQSLNVSVACAVSVFEAFRQRQKAKMFDKTELTETEINSKLIEWLRK